jgi:hypothetical protein
MDPDKAPMVLKADDAVNLRLGHAADLVIAHAAFRALKT